MKQIKSETQMFSLIFEQIFVKVFKTVSLNYTYILFILFDCIFYDFFYNSNQIFDYSLVFEITRNYLINPQTEYYCNSIIKKLV